MRWFTNLTQSSHSCRGHTYLCELAGHCLHVASEVVRCVSVDRPKLSRPGNRGPQGHRVTQSDSQRLHGDPPPCSLPVSRHRAPKNKIAEVGCRAVMEHRSSVQCQLGDTQGLKFVWSVRRWFPPFSQWDVNLSPHAFPNGKRRLVFWRHREFIIVWDKLSQTAAPVVF